MPEDNNTINSSEAVTDNQTPKTFTFDIAGKDNDGKIGKGQWTLEVKEIEPGSGIFNFEGFNLDPDTGMKRFFNFNNSGPFGQLMINPEPDLGMPLNELGYSYKLTGCILINADGTVKDRFSLTKKTFIQGVKVTFDQSTRELFFDGNPSGFYLAVLVIKDKNRIKGSDGYFVTAKTEKVTEVELENAVNGILREMGLIA